VIPGASPSSFPELLGESAVMRSVHARIGRALEVELPVFIEGETGTGKDLAARLIHDRGSRRAGPFVHLNCATVGESLLEARLFGHRRGVLPGADRSGPGPLMAARSGTLFLDEVGELSSGAQRKLLQVVDSGEVVPVGAERVARTDARIIAATSASLEAAVEAGRFRRDLYYRLRVLTLRLPPLRERREDITLLARCLLETVCRRLAVPSHRLSEEALAALGAATWPGNVRQLIHELERAVVTSEGLEIELGDLSPELQGVVSERARSTRIVSGQSAELTASPKPSDAAVDALLRRLAGLSDPHGTIMPRAAVSIAGYRLIEKIAEGGMGEVWRAEQREPVRREVAIKLIRPGVETPVVVARFEAERQALALMDHPAIPRVLAAGSTDQGHPYLAMEYLRGVALDLHCDQARLGLRTRIELFRQVCAGVQHAHQKAILHRDLKPSNVLVTLIDGQAQAKIIDFGVAKALAQPLTERSLQTEVGQVVGTVEFMSPEQADLTQQDIDTRTDVYSLGAMLYQLVSGFLPFSSAELRRASQEELRRCMHEVDPLPPSARLIAATEEAVAIARRRNSDLRILQREIAGDLDAIIMKALEKDRARRYESVAELSSDLRRWLDHQSVTARTSRAGSLWRYLRMHRTRVAAVAGTALLLLQMGFSANLALQLRLANRLPEARVPLAAPSTPSTEGTSGWRLGANAPEAELRGSRPVASIRRMAGP
jgi:transcriptional regulator with AAA-type ATPase domain/serine/threonine protein kinase